MRILNNDDDDDAVWAVDDSTSSSDDDTAPVLAMQPGSGDGAESSAEHVTADGSAAAVIASGGDGKTFHVSLPPNAGGVREGQVRDGREQAAIEEEQDKVNGKGEGAEEDGEGTGGLGNTRGVDQA